MSYNYELCFWDPNDNGVNILLEHISAGIRSCETMVGFFKQRSELEKDYARRLGAINTKLTKDMENNPEYGHLDNSFKVLLQNEKARSNAHSKQSELIYRQIYSDVKAFVGKLQARYSTLSGKIEKLRVDKYNKKKGCEDLTKRIQEAQIRIRDLELNQSSMIGARKTEQNKKELAKWESNSQEINIQLDVLKQEYKASQKFWFKEWASLTNEFQEMETARISFLQSKMQQYAQATMETSLLEQARMESLMNNLVTFTPADDIADFSSAYGTGRLKEKRNSTIKPTESRLRAPNTSTTSDKRNSYVENVRKFSSQLNRQSSIPLGDSRLDKRIHSPKPEPQPQNQQQQQQENPYRPTVREIRVIQQTNVGSKQQNAHNDQSVPHSPYHHSNLSPKQHKAVSSSSSASSSIPTDFTAHVKSRHSMDSITTSVSSMASSIDDSQRFAKSWNSSNRKRKSMSHLQQQSPSPIIRQNSNENLENQNPQLRNSSTNTTIVNPDITSREHMRRKSMVLQDSNNPIEDALYEMERIKSNGFSSSDIRVGRVRDNGITVTLPIVTTEGDPVIKYAKAVYPLTDNNATELAHFEKGDYLLLTACVNKDWFRGEVYGNDMIDKAHKVGLIPYNFIQLLS